MRKVTVSRPQKIQLPFSKGKILIDEKECEIVKAGKTATFEVDDGNYSIQVVFAAAPPVSSNILYIDQSEGDVEFEVKINVPLKNQETTAELTKK